MKKPNIIIHLLLAVFGSFLFIGCDQLKDDVLPESAELISLNQLEKSQYIMPGGEAMIDVTSKLRTHQNATLEIGERPKNGSLQFVDGGLLKYAASENFKKGTDFFTLTVMRNSQVLDQDTINIIIPSDSTQYPCWSGAIGDTFFVKKDSAEVPHVFDVMANDYFCDSTTSSLAIIQQPQYGSAEIVDHLFHFKSDFGDAKILVLEDYIIYELCQTLDGGEQHCTLAKANVDFQKKETCDMDAVDDVYILGDDPESSETTSLAKVDVLANDQTCNSLKELSITKNADNGEAYIEDNYLYYSYPNQDLYPDSLSYKICNLEGICNEATVRFGIQ